jgi:DNA-directed RNA polymerase subunit RPC12/RpoP
VPDDGGTLDFVSEAAAHDKLPVVCPHCKKPFNADPLPGPAARYRGFKCPHCRLFVPAERARLPRER